MRKIFLLPTLLFLAATVNHISSQDFQTKFNKAFTENDTLTQRNILENWETQTPNDPELYVAYFNYHIARSTVIIENDVDLPPSIGIFHESYFNPTELKKAFRYINAGIEKFPNRLDMRLGEVYMLGEVENFTVFTQKIVNIVEQSEANQNKWLWINNVPLDSGEYAMHNAVEDYQGLLYNKRDVELYPFIEKIAETVLKHYPNNITSLCYLSISYLAKDEYDKALEILHRIEKIDSSDYELLNDIAHTYKLKGDKKNAIKYYKLTKKHGNDVVKKFADEQIKELNSK